MKKGMLVVLCACVLLAASFIAMGCSSSSDSSTSPSEPVDVTGVWSMNADGFMTLTLTLTQSGTTVTGTSTPYEGTITGDVSGSSITLTIVFSDLQTTTFTGSVNGNTMSGSYRGGYPDSDIHTGPWSATKQ